MYKRQVPEGADAISPAPHHDIYSIEDLRQLVCSLKEATAHRKPVLVKVAAVHNIAAIASGVARSGADIIEIDGFSGGTGAAPARIRDNVGIPIELALAAVDTRLREEKIRGEVSIIAAGSIRSSADVVKALACLLYTSQAQADLSAHVFALVRRGDIEVARVVKGRLGGAALFVGLKEVELCLLYTSIRSWIT